MWILRLIKRKSIIYILRRFFHVHTDKRLVNICGGEWYYPRWENIDFDKSVDKFYIDYNIDLNKEYKLPFDNETVQIIFCSHGIYYLTEDAGKYLLEECYRVLKPNGLIRLVTANFDTDIGKHMLEKEEEMKQYPNTDKYYMCRILSHYSYMDLYNILEKIGFIHIQQMSNKKSNVPKLTHSIFECNMGNRPTWSIYIEAKK